MRRWSVSPISGELYLDFETACVAIAAAREAAAEVGRPQRAPPQPLDECDQATIETALGAPFVGVVDREFYSDLHAKAAVLLFTLAKSQACQDGNKRVAAILVETFLALNGHMLDTSNEELERVIRRTEASGASDRDGTLAELTEWMGVAIVPLTERENP